MPLNPDAVGASSATKQISWTSKDALLYAVGVGAGIGELAYATENTRGVPQQVLPTFATVIDGMFAGDLPDVGNYDPAMLVHGQQSVTLHRPLAPDGAGSSTTRVEGIYDKGKAGVIAFAADVLGDDGVPLFTTRSTVFVRGAGGFGGDRGPSAPDNAPPERSPDHEVTYQTSVDQALVYRLSGDRNPLHSDPAYAAQAGFDHPILQGLCTYGFTGRALLHSLCDGDSSRFHHIEGRFTTPVFPGEALTIRVWRTDAGVARFNTSVGDRVVLDSGLVHFG